jgi:metal-responsive CopG/Arc/MetJ family transcriptional regulator
MKVKTSVTLSEELVALIDQDTGGKNSRSSFMERAVRTYLELTNRSKRDQEDPEIINRLSGRLNGEVTDVLRWSSARWCALRMMVCPCRPLPASRGA